MADLFEDAEEEVAPNVVSLHQSVQPVATITSQAPAAATLPKSKQPVSQRYNDDDDGDAPAFQAEEFPSLGSSGVAPAVWPKQAAAAAAQHSAAAPATPVNKPIKTLGKPPGSKPAAPKSTPPPTTPSETATSTPAEVFDRSKSDLLVVDAAAFIKNVPLQDMAHRLVTLSDVVAEIRDAETRRRLQVLPYELELREPSSEAIKFGR
jgi:RNA-binding protein NOB1